VHIIEFGPQRIGELLGDTHQLVVGGRLPSPTGADREIAQNLQIPLDEFDNMRSAHLDYYVGLVVHRRGVRLS